jgi:hypothetical protein
MGTEIVDDIRLGHTWEEYRVLREFIFDIYPTWFIEVGVHEGGLSYLLLPDMEDIAYLGIEIDCGIVRPAVKQRYRENPNAELLCANCFSSTVAVEVQVRKNKIIYCDGGNKVKELHHFKHMCQPGDILMAHDYWDGNRVIAGVDEVHAEVLPMDIIEIDNSRYFTRLDENIFNETRIIGWTRNEQKKTE